MAKKKEIQEKEVKELKSIYNGPEPIKIGSSIETIEKELQVGHLFTRKDSSVIKVTKIANDTVRLTVLDIRGNETDEHRVFPIQLFAKLFMNRHFEPTKIARRESYTEVATKYEFGKLLRG